MEKKCDNCAIQLICKFRNPYTEDCGTWEKIENKGVDYTSQITFN